jgi:hypothetical protein
MGDGDGVGGLLGLAEADEQAAINACASIHCGSSCKSASAKKMTCREGTKEGDSRQLAKRLSQLHIFFRASQLHDNDLAETCRSLQIDLQCPSPALHRSIRIRIAT